MDGNSNFECGTIIEGRPEAVPTSLKLTQLEVYTGICKSYSFSV